MNRTRRKAMKMFRRKYGQARYSFWMAQPRTPEERADDLRRLGDAMREMYARCTSGATLTINHIA